MRMSTELRFWSKVDISNGCWIWTAYKDRQGYGKFRMGDMQHSSRVAWILTNGAIPTDICVLHKCDNPSCCNPDHLFLGTHNDNMNDCKQKGRNKNNPMHGESNTSSKLKDHQVLEIRRLAGTMYQKELAAIFGVKQGVISKIILRQAWCHI
jgi:HNH endonuclease